MGLPNIYGWKPVCRGSQTFAVRERDFDNPVVREHYTATSGGTSGRPVRVRIDIEELAEAAANWAVCFDAHGWKDRPLVFWTPGHSGFANCYLRCLKFGFPYLKWFRTTRPDNLAALLHRTLQFLTGLPAPEPAPLDRAPVVLRFLLRLLEKGDKPIVNTTPSAACRLARLAGDRGLSLSGVAFLLEAEPVTRVRRSIIECSGAAAIPTYGTSEAGWIGAQFPEAREADEVSVFRDAYAVIQRPDGESSALSDEQMEPLGNDGALLTYKTTVDGTCGGQKVPANSWAAGIYVRDGDTWKGAFHAEAPIVDPKAAPAMPAVKEEAPKKDEAKPPAPDAGTDALVAVEKAVWEAWKEHDAKKLEELTAEDISFVNIFGTYFATKADVIKDWTGPGCDIKSVSVTDGVGTMLSPTVGILTHTGTADGTCFGQKVGSVWGTSVYVKDGDEWKWAFGINLPARQGL